MPRTSKQHLSVPKEEIIIPKITFFNRELAWLQFNQRVLCEAEDIHHPLLERLKFLLIFCSNLDEFFMIRVAGLKEQLENNSLEISSDGMTPREQLIEIREQLIPLLVRHENCFQHDVMPALREKDIFIHTFEELHNKEKEFAKNYFENDVLPVLTPLALDTAHPFPRLLNRSLTIVFLLRDEIRPGRKIAVLQVPPILSRLVQLKRSSGSHFILIEHIIQEYAYMLFPGYFIEESYSFRVTRDAELEIAEDEASDLISEIAEQVRQRRWGTDAIRLEIEEKAPDSLIQLLMKALDLQLFDVYKTNVPLNPTDLMSLFKLEKPELKDAPFFSKKILEFTNDPDDVFEAIRKRDFLVHHPFDSFTNSVVKFIDAAANDNNVLAIKITLYRAGGSSPVVDALKRAAENGKQVTAFVELRARFDEENNIIWARELERVGVHVVYGILGLKIHTKITLVVRKEGKKIRTYLHLSTGNYNVSSSRIYTDIGYFTVREDFGKDAIALFNLLTGYSHQDEWQRISVAPEGLKQKVLDLIIRETEKSTQERPGFIFAKMNALVDEEVIQALYKASQHGVKIQLLIRGVCCLIPGIKGLSDNIEVRSILGRFLEHSRIFYFSNGGDEAEIYLASADWMPRNFMRRVEIMFPILDQKSYHLLEHILAVYWQDTVKSWLLNPNGSYTRLQSQEDNAIWAQNHFLQEILSNKKYPIKLKKLR
ncbi:MAG: polyphosphate kinase 1 [Bacteroidota bacterium]